MPGSPNYSLNSHRNCHWNVRRVFDVCLELEGNCTSYFKFVVDKFSELVNTKNAMFLTMAWSDRWSRSADSQNARNIPEKYKSRIIWTIWIIWTIALHFWTDIKVLPICFDYFCGHSYLNNFDCWVFSLFETVTDSQIKGKPVANLLYAQAWRNCPPQIHNNF